MHNRAIDKPEMTSKTVLPDYYRKAGGMSSVFKTGIFLNQGACHSRLMLGLAGIN